MWANIRPESKCVFEDTRVSILISQHNTVKGLVALSSPIVTHACERFLDETEGKRVGDREKDGGIFMQF